MLAFEDALSEAGLAESGMGAVVLALDFFAPDFLPADLEGETGERGKSGLRKGLKA